MNSPALTGDRLLVDLASAELGARVLHATDEFFAEAANLLRPEPPEWREGVFTDRGKWMDGWESRRRRGPGHDICLIELGAPGSIRAVDVLTTHFRGNQPEACSLDGLSARIGADPTELLESRAWAPILRREPLGPDAGHRFEIPGDSPTVTHVRFSMHPDGGVARLRLHGVVRPNLAAGPDAEPIDVAALQAGGLPIAVSDATFGEPRNLLLPGPSTHMGQGWETRRRRGPGHDWVVIRLGCRARIAGARLETDHFKGNYPAAADLEIADLGRPDVGAGPGDPSGVGHASGASQGSGVEGPPEDAWVPLLARTELAPDARHTWDRELMSEGPATHVRLNIHPDGGVARLRIFGWPA